jgi:hypothetical protein
MLLSSFNDIALAIANHFDLDGKASARALALPPSPFLPLQKTGIRDRRTDFVSAAGISLFRLPGLPDHCYADLKYRRDSELHPFVFEEKYPS